MPPEPDAPQRPSRSGGVAPTGRRRRDLTLAWVREQVAFLVVVVGIAATFVFLLVQPGHWRRGTAAMSLVVLLAGVLRLVLPGARVGYLAIRSRWLDALCLFVFGGLILAVDLRLRS